MLLYLKGTLNLSIKARNILDVLETIRKPLRRKTRECEAPVVYANF